MSIAIDNLTLRYGQREAVAGLTVVVPDGAVGLLGRNGSGKTSILKAMLGLVRPASGRVAFAGLAPDASSADVRAHVGYMPERDAYLPQATGFQMVAMLGMLNGMPQRDAWRRAHEVLYLVGLEEQRYRPVAGFSTGMRQKVKLAAALVHDPQVLFLDEPTNGLDPAGRADMLGLVGRMARDLQKSVLFSTHILHDVESVCSAAIVLEQGRVVAQGSLASLTGGPVRQHGLVVDRPSVALEAALAAVGTVTRETNGGYSIVLAPGRETRAVFAACSIAGAAVLALVPHRRSLEEVFLHAVNAPSPSSGANARP